MTVEERRRARPRGPVGSFGVVKLVLGMLLLGGVLYVCVEAAGGRRMLDISMLNGSSLDVGAALASIGLTMSSSSKGLEIKEYCRSEHSKALASSFLKKREDVPFYTACPKSTWMNEFQSQCGNGRRGACLGGERGRVPGARRLHGRGCMHMAA